LIIFCLLFPVALWISKLWSPIPVLLGTAFKLYPVFALGALLIKCEFRLFAASLLEGDDFCLSLGPTGRYLVQHTGRMLDGVRISKCQILPLF
jgi:hypothetical protein